MFIQNQISHLINHRNVIETEIDNADEMLFVVAYVRENGVDVILDRIKEVLPSFLWVKAKQWSRMWYKSLFLWRYSNERYRVVYSTFGA